MVASYFSMIDELNAVVPRRGVKQIRDLVSELADKHHFNLECPGYILWVKAPQDASFADDPKLRIHPLGDLAICRTDQEYILGISTPDGPGFKVHYSWDWLPLRAINHNGCPYRNLASANEQMILLINLYRASNRSLVTELH